MAEHEIQTVERDLEPIQQGQEWNKVVAVKELVDGEEVAKDISSWGGAELVLKDDYETDRVDADIDNSYPSTPNSDDGAIQISLSETETSSLSEGEHRYRLELVDEDGDNHLAYHGEVYVIYE